MTQLSRQQKVQILSELDAVIDCVDLLLNDTAAGISSNVMDFNVIAQEIIVVVSPEPTAITDAYATIKVVSQVGENPHVGLVVNLCRSKSEGQNTYERLAGVANRFLEFAVFDFGYILSDDNVVRAVRQRMPLALRYPRSSAAACVAGIAARLARDLETSRVSHGFLRLVASMFM